MKPFICCLLLLLSLSLFAQEKGATPIPKSPIPNTPIPNTPIPNTYAVVVGISDYQDEAIPDLRFADRDAEAFANFLRSPAGGNLDGDHLKIMVNEQATSGKVGAALFWLMEKAKENDRVIIYFSGHGDVEQIMVGQPGFLLCWDAPSRVYMAGGTVQLGMLQSVISTLSRNNQVKIYVITDACRSGKLSGTGIDGARATTANLAQQYANEIKILSCQPEEYSIEGEQWGGGRGAFSYHLVDGLYGMADRNGDLSVNLLEIGRYLEDKVTVEVAPLSQIPMTVGSRGEKLTDVFPDILEQLKEDRKGQLPLISNTESRGIEEEVLAAADTSLVALYDSFNEALNNKHFLSPRNACADFYYEKLSKEPQLEPLHSSMRRNYSAALQDDAQQWMNTMLKSGLTEMVLKAAKAEVVFKKYPAYLERAAELLGKEHYMYNALQARKYLFAGKLKWQKQDRRELYRRALSIQPNMPLAMTEMIMDLECGDIDSAEYYFQKATKLVPSWVEPYIAMSKFYGLCYNYQKKEEMLLRARQLDSTSAYVAYELGWYYGNQKKQQDQSIIYYEQAIKLTGNDICFPCAYNNLGFAYKLTNRMDEAEKYFIKAMELDPGLWQPYTNLVEIYCKRGDLEKAEKLNLKYFEIDSTNANSYQVLGNLYTNYLKRYGDAEKLFKKAIQLEPDFYWRYSDLATFYRRTGRFEEAEKLYLEYSRIDSNNLWVYYDLGVLYCADFKRYEEAEKFFNKALSIDSTEYSVYGYLLYCYQIANRDKEAQDLFDRAISICKNNLSQNPTNPNHYWGAAMLYRMMEKYSEAEQYALKNLAMNPNSSGGAYTMAIVKSRQHKSKEALEWMDKALATNYPHNDYRELNSYYHNEKSFDNIRDLPEYRKILKKYFRDLVSE